MKAEIVKRSFIVRLHRGLSNSKEVVFGLHRMSGREKSKAAASRAKKVKISENWITVSSWKDS